MREGGGVIECACGHGVYLQFGVGFGCHSKYAVVEVS